jgi:hypothetical protein
MPKRRDKKVFGSHTEHLEWGRKRLLAYCRLPVGVPKQKRRIMHRATRRKEGTNKKKERTHYGRKRRHHNFKFTGILQEQQAVMAPVSMLSSFATNLNSKANYKVDNTINHEVDLPRKQSPSDFSDLDGNTCFDDAEQLPPLVKPCEQGFWLNDALEIDKAMSMLESDANSSVFQHDQQSEPIPIHPNHSIHVVASIQDLQEQLIAFREEYTLLLENLQEDDVIQNEASARSYLSVDKDKTKDHWTRGPVVSPLVTTSSPHPPPQSSRATNAAQTKRRIVETATLSGPEATIHPYQNQKWMVNYKELLDYKARQGHCHVPFHDKENPSLSQWVKRQRHQYKCLKAGKHSHLNTDRIKMLEMIGFTWDSHAAAWEENFQALKEFNRKYNTTKVPVSCSQLSTWVKRQRRQYRRFVLKQRSTMTPDRIRMISELGLTWNAGGKPMF